MAISTILMVSASPLDQDRLRLNAEFQTIREARRRSSNREQWKLETNEAVTVDDLRRALLDFRPKILHFSGHGGGEAGLCFEDINGRTNLAQAESLAKLLHHFKEHLKCVVLNACFSSIQGEVIKREIDYVVGMRSAVDDDSASQFALAFYDAVFAGRDFRTAFDLGCTALDLKHIPDSDTPVLMTGSHISPTVLSYSALLPEIERVLYIYFNTPFEDRFKFTTTGEASLPIMESHYRSRTHRHTKKVRVLSLKAIGDGQWYVELTGSPESRVAYIYVSQGNIQIEWEASVGLWSLPAKTFLALGPREPIVARVRAELDTYYNFDFSGQKDHFQSVALRAYDDVSLHGYINRRSDAYERLISILSDGNEHAITLEIRHVTNETSTVLIDKLLSETWVYSTSSGNS